MLGRYFLLREPRPSVELSFDPRLGPVPLAGVDVLYILDFRLCSLCSFLLQRDMPVGATHLLGLFDPLQLLLSRGAGITPCGMGTFAHCALGEKKEGGESLHFLLLAVSGLMQLSAIAANLRRVALSADVAVLVAAEALLHSAGAVVELALMFSHKKYMACIVIFS